MFIGCARGQRTLTPPTWALSVAAEWQPSDKCVTRREDPFPAQAVGAKRTSGKGRAGCRSVPTDSRGAGRRLQFQTMPAETRLAPRFLARLAVSSKAPQV